MVDTGISGSSVLATADRTSGYGESSSARRRQLQVSIQERENADLG